MFNFHGLPYPQKYFDMKIFCMKSHFFLKTRNLDLPSGLHSTLQQLKLVSSKVVHCGQVELYAHWTLDPVLEKLEKLDNITTQNIVKSSIIFVFVYYVSFSTWYMQLC